MSVHVTTSDLITAIQREVVGGARNIGPPLQITDWRLSYFLQIIRELTTPHCVTKGEAPHIENSVSTSQVQRSSSFHWHQLGTVKIRDEQGRARPYLPFHGRNE